MTTDSKNPAKTTTEKALFDLQFALTMLGCGRMEDAGKHFNNCLKQLADIIDAEKRTTRLHLIATYNTKAAAKGFLVGQIILGRRDTSGEHPYFTGWRGVDEDTHETNTSYHYGSYFATVEEATNDFLTRVGKAG